MKRMRSESKVSTADILSTAEKSLLKPERSTSKDSSTSTTPETLGVCELCLARERMLKEHVEALNRIESIALRMGHSLNAVKFQHLQLTAEIMSAIVGLTPDEPL